MNRKGRQTRRNYQVLRADASPRRSELHLLLRRGSHGFAGLAPHFGRSSRPIPSFLFRGLEDFPFTTGPRPQDNRASIGKTTIHVNPLQCGGDRLRSKISRAVRIPARPRPSPRPTGGHFAAARTTIHDSYLGSRSTKRDGKSDYPRTILSIQLTTRLLNDSPNPTRLIARAAPLPDPGLSKPLACRQPVAAVSHPWPASLYRGSETA